MMYYEFLFNENIKMPLHYRLRFLIQKWICKIFGRTKSFFKKRKSVEITTKIGDNQFATISYDEFGNFHRDDDFPAYIYHDQNKTVYFAIYYKHGKVHRETGPAIREHSTALYFLEDRAYTKEGWFAQLNKEQKMKALFNMDECL